MRSERACVPASHEYFGGAVSLSSSAAASKRGIVQCGSCPSAVHVSQIAPFVAPVMVIVAGQDTRDKGGWISIAQFTSCLASS